MGVPQLLTIGGVGMLAIYGAYRTDDALASKEPPVRTLSGISASSAYQGLQKKDGLLTSINIKDSLNQIATPEERAALDGNSPSADNFGLDKVGNIQNVSFGAAAETSPTDGLGMGANRTDITEGGSSSVRGAGSQPGVTLPGNLGQAGAAASGSTATLAPASMARASGNAFNAAAGAIGGSAAGGAGTRSAASSAAAGGSAASGEGYQFSGAMPSGSNMVSAFQSRRANSTFVAGGRDSSSARARRSFREKNELKDISKRSADAARNQNRSANEGARAFLASTRNSGGLRVEGGVETTSTGSADFENPTNQKLKAVGSWVQQEDEFAKKQEKARKRLMWMALSLFALTIGMIPAVYHLVSKGKQAGLFGWTFVAWGIILAGVVGAYAATVLGFAVDYQTKYNGNFLPIMGYLLSAGSMVAMAWTVLSALKSGGTSSEAHKLFMKKSVGAAKSVGMMGLTTGGKEAVNKLMEKDASASQSSKK